MWNIGEVLGVFDRARNTGRINSRTHSIARKRFLLETRRMLRIGLAVVVPLKARIMMNSWELIEKHHIYEADAIQIASAMNVNASKFLTGDEKLHEIAGKEGLESVYLK
ncbi:MAG: type II toxin-antitoxin system VapC family toxin [Desulfurococcales archaeon]|nr:type II toxin-antitoxin system VapC family toxin [Desulfurococcales archaeon]